MAPRSTREPLPPGKLRHRPAFVRFWTAATLSDFGSAITALALQTLVLRDLGGSTTDVGLVNGARWLAYPVVGLVAGLWIDRLRRRPVLVVTDLGRGVLLATICALALTDRLAVFALVGLMALFGLLSLGNDSATQSYLPHLVPRTLLVRANARLEQSTAFASTTGPALSGLLIKVVSAPVAILVDAVSYLVSGIVTATIPLDERRVDRSTRRRARVEITEGLRWAYTHPTLGPLSRNSHAWFLCWAVLGTVSIAYAFDELAFSPLTYGLALSLGGVATLVGTSVSERLTHRWGEGRVILISRFGYAPGVALIVLAPAGTASGPSGAAIAMIIASQVIIGLVFGAEGPPEMSYRQAVTPDRLQGRVNTTLRSVNRTMIVVGAPLGGLLADHAGPRVALTVAAVGFFLVGVAFGRTKAATARFVHDEDGPA